MQDLETRYLTTQWRTEVTIANVVDGDDVGYRERLARIAGGATVSPTNGDWIAPDSGDLLSERGFTYVVLTDTLEQAQRVVDTSLDFAEWLGEEAIAYNIQTVFGGVAYTNRKDRG